MTTATDTTPVTAEALAKLREMAEAATPGPWRAYQARLRPTFGPIINEVQCDDLPIVTWLGFDESRRPAAQHAANAAYIAAFDPPTVLSLLAEVERLKRKLDDAYKQMLPITDDGNFVWIDGAGEVEIDHGGKLRARAKVAEAEVTRLRGAIAATPVTDEMVDRALDAADYCRNADTRRWMRAAIEAACAGTQATDHARLYAALRAMVATFKPFLSRPIGAPGSLARLDQEEQRRVYAEALAALGEATHDTR